MSKKILVVGSGSFIANHWRHADVNNSVSFLPHGDFSADIAAGCDAIVNCAIAPSFKQGVYSESADQDLAAARFAARQGKHFVMLSTRKVYQASPFTAVLSESSPLGPCDAYGQNKLESESRILAMLGENCTILRIANVFGYELGRRSFFGLAMTRLKQENRISLDVSPFIERDFVAVEVLVDLLQRICQAKPSGIFNIGSGYPLALGRVAQWLIEGYGSGGLTITDMAERDGFVMDIRKLKRALSIESMPNELEMRIKTIGSRLFHE